MTALPIVETMQGEIAAYIPTNLISITDGQIYLDQNLFAGGFRPAIDIRRSVSRIGGQAQHPRIKAEAGSMKLDYLQFLELEIFTRFGARLEASMEAAIRRGRALREILKQDRLAPLSAECQMALLIAFNDGHFDDIQEHDTIRESLAALEAAVKDSPLTLDSPREQWAQAIAGCLSSAGEQHRDEKPPPA
jgi:F-type H+-transporting ATPase subunit alpha